MRKIWARLSQFDELDYVTLPRSGRLYLAYRTGAKRLRQAVLFASAVGWIVAANLIEMPDGIGTLVGGGIVLTFVLLAGARRVRLSDAVLIQAAGRATLELGAERKPGWWRIRGPRAGALARDLDRLNRLPWPLPLGGDPAQAREEQLLAAAGPELRAYLRPILTAAEGYEPRQVESAPPEADSGWPLLSDRRGQAEAEGRPR